MLRTSRYGAVLIMCICLSAIGRGAEDTGISGRLIRPELYKLAQLTTVWQNKLPIKKPETLQQLTILNDRLYILTSQNFLFCLDRQKEKMIFGKSIAPAGIPVLGLDLNRDTLISIIGNKLVMLDPNSGTVLKSFPLELRVVCPAAFNNSFFYFACTDNRLHALRAKDMVAAFEASADNDSMITSVIADEQSVICGTNAGNVISIAPDRPIKLWQFNAGGTIVGPIVRDESSLFFATQETYVYRIDIIDISTGVFVWKCQMPGLLYKQPCVTPSAVYQYAEGYGLTAIDRDSGTIIWSLDKGRDLLAEAANRVYIITAAGTLVVMNNNTQKKLCEVSFAGISKYAVNTIDSKIYAADDNGLVTCLQPAR